MKVWSDVRAALALVSARDRRVLVLVSVLQASLALLDLIAVVLIGLVALLAAGAATGDIPPLIDRAMQTFGVSEDDPYSLAVTLGVVAGLLMVAKSAASFFVTRRVFALLANRQAMISSKLASQLLTQPLLDVQRRSSQEVGYALTVGVNAITLGVLGQAVVIVAEASLLVAFAVGLFFIDPIVTLFTVVFFAVVGLGLHKLIAGWTERLGRESSDTQIESYEAVQEVLRTYREVSVMGRRGMFVERFRDLRWVAARVQANLQVMGQVSKYVFEVALIVGGALLAASQFLTRDSAAAVAVIAVFLAAASRVMPSLLRLQSAALIIRREGGTAEDTFALAAELDLATKTVEPVQLGPEVRTRLQDGMTHGYPGFEASVDLQGVSLTYPGADRPAAHAVTLRIPAATSLALVGSTGAGKSTLADIILGVLTPDEGSVSLSGTSPSEAIREWPGAVSYVPQDIAVMNADIRRNVALGLPEELIDDTRVWEALERAHLADFLRDQREGLLTIVGEHGVRLSGGQRQRLGLARALYTRPRLLVLDEATSALDAETEATIAASIADLSGEVTLIIIAHRLATIRDCDQVAYIDAGRLASIGTFDEVRDAAPALNRQAKLLGL